MILTRPMPRHASAYLETLEREPLASTPLNLDSSLLVRLVELCGQLPAILKPPFRLLAGLLLCAWWLWDQAVLLLTSQAFDRGLQRTARVCVFAACTVFALVVLLIGWMAVWG